MESIEEILGDTKTLGEVNREFWDANADKLFSQDWVKVLGEQLSALLLSNVEAIGLRKPSADGPPVKMLDYACGFGLASLALGSHVQVLRGMDISQTMVDRYNETGERAGFSPQQMRAVRLDLLTNDGDADVLQTADFSGFDLVVLSMALHHVSDHQLLITRLVERLRPGGVVAVIDWPPSKYGNAFRHGKDDGPGKTVHVHHQEFSDAYMAGLFGTAGCTPASFRYVLHDEESLVPENVTKVPGGISRKAFLASAKKAE